MNNQMYQERWNIWNNFGGPKYPHKKVVQLTFRNFPPEIRPKTRVLDLGCGSGVHTRFLADKGFQAFATDISEVGIRNIKNLLAEHQLTAALKKESINFISFPDEFFNYVLSIRCFDCVGSIIACAAVLEIIRVLKPGGKTLLMFAGNVDYRIWGYNIHELYGFSEEEINIMIHQQGLSVRQIGRYITIYNYENQAQQENDFLIILQKKDC